jgi:putative hydrolase of the HAD superfamily
MQEFFRGIFQECLIGNADLREILPSYLNEWGWKDGVDSYLKHWFDSENLPDHALIKRAQELRKSGIKCYVATNQEKYRLAYLRETM